MLGRVFVTTDRSSRLLPLICGVLSLLGAIFWNPAAVVLGLAVVAFWGLFASVVATGIARSKAVGVARAGRPPLGAARRPG
jgi:hypothetical protein